jgi:hypothetical protein
LKIGPGSGFVLSIWNMTFSPIWVVLWFCWEPQNLGFFNFANQRNPNSTFRKFPEPQNLQFWFWNSFRIKRISISGFLKICKIWWFSKWWKNWWIRIGSLNWFFEFSKTPVKGENQLCDFLEPPVNGHTQFFLFENHWSKYTYATFTHQF